MTKSDLIKELEQYPDDTIVYFQVGTYYPPCYSEVESITTESF